MSPRDAATVDHIAADLTDLSDTDLARLARKNACLPGENAAAVRRAVDKEQEFRRATRRAHRDACPECTEYAGSWAGEHVTCATCGKPGRSL